MVLFSNAKINLGLNIVSKREDGFHNIETIFYPVDFCDIIEIREANKFNIVNTGLIVDELIENNLCTKAYILLKQKYSISPVEIHLHKQVPFGAGLGGGSSNASFVLKALNVLFDLNITDEELGKLASQLGSDCAFFIKNKASYATQRGDILENLELDLSKYFISIVHPNIHVNTSEAYRGISPKSTKVSLKQIAKEPIGKWKEMMINDFETNVFKLHPKIKGIKEQLYKNGAVYASMSGSGSSVYGIFEKETKLSDIFRDYTCWSGRLL